MSGKGFLDKDQMAAAKERVGAGDAADAGGDRPPVESSPAPSGGQEDLTPKQEPEQGGDAPAKEPVFVDMPLEGGKSVKVDQEELVRLAKLGMKAGDEKSIQTVRDLENFVRENPEAAPALEALVKDPQAAARIVEELGGSKEPEGGNEDPRDKEIRELKAENERLQRGGGTGGKSAQEIVKEASAHYPALSNLPLTILTQAVEGRMAKGESLSSAMANLAAEQADHEAAGADRKRGAAEKSRSLQGAGGGGGAPSLVPDGQKPSGKSLHNGGALAAAKRRLAGR